MQLTKLRVFLLLLLAVLSSGLTVWHFTVASPSPAQNLTCEPGGCNGPSASCTDNIWLDGTTPVDTRVRASQIVGTVGQDLSAFLSSTVGFASGQHACLSGQTGYTITTTFTVPPTTMISGAGGGQLWNDAQPAETKITCSLTVNNQPCLKITDATKAEGITLEDFKLFYGGSATGIDGIYFDGVTSTSTRHDIISRVNIQDFTGYCIHSVGTVFDIHYYSVGMMSCNLGGELVDPGASGVPTQHFFYAPTIIENVASKWAMNMTACSQCAIFGGTIANGVNGGNGLFVKGLNSFGVMNVNFEGASNAFGTGLDYFSGTGLTIEGGGGIIQTWAIGLEIGPDPSGSASATLWYVNGNWASNTVDIKITAGGSRNGIIGPLGTSFSTLTNNRATVDGVYSDLLEEFMPNSASYPAPASITPGASPWSYTNQLFYNQIININIGVGGSISSVTVGGITICNNGPCSLMLPPGKIAITTWATTAPVVSRSYAGP